MFGTGYRVDVARYPFIGPRASSRGPAPGDGYPVLGRGLESSVPGLHFTGAPAAWSFGPIMRFVSGSWYAGRAIAREIAARSPGGRSAPCGRSRGAARATGGRQGRTGARQPQALPARS